MEAVALNIAPIRAWCHNLWVLEDKLTQHWNFSWSGL